MGKFNRGNGVMADQLSLDESEIRQNMIDRIADAARVISAQAGVGAMETAGSIVSFLSANPHWLGHFLAGGSIIDWPDGWHLAGCLTWQGMDGKVHWPGELEPKQ